MELHVAKFRKRPPIIEAVQWFPGVVIEGVEEVGTNHGRPRGMIERGSRQVFAEPGDWIVQEATGDKYPVTARLFEALYEPLEDIQEAQA